MRARAKFDDELMATLFNQGFGAKSVAGDSKPQMFNQLDGFIGRGSGF